MKKLKGKKAPGRNASGHPEHDLAAPVPRVDATEDILARDRFTNELDTLEWRILVMIGACVVERRKLGKREHRVLVKIEDGPAMPRKPELLISACRGAIQAGDERFAGELIKTLDDYLRAAVSSRGGRSKKPSPAETIVHNCIRDLEERDVPRTGWLPQIRSALRDGRYPRSDKQIRRILKKLGK